MRLVGRSFAVFLLGLCMIGQESGAMSARYFENSVSSTVGWSEWCPPGVVTVDLDTGQFRWFQQLPFKECAKATVLPVIVGKLSPEILKSVREAVLVAQRDGLARSECEKGKRSDVVVISNGGSAYLLTVTTPRNGMSAPGDLSCWTKAAFVLQRVLDDQFDVERPRN